MGSADVAFADVVRALFGVDDSVATQIVWQLRLPRAINGFVTGGLLALAGALLQVLLRNPLAEPYILGVAGGAAAGALLALMAGLAGGWISTAACAGALGSMLLVFGLARSGGDLNPLRLLLTGVVVAAGWGAVVSLLLALSPDRSLRGMLFWLLGDLSHSELSSWPGAILLAGLVVSTALGRRLNLLVHGDLQAAALGVDVRQMRVLLYFLAALLTAAAVMQAGTLGFVGLVVPHALRLVLGSDHRRLLPACVLGGGCLVVLADTLARTLIAPRQLPVGVLIACLGVPVFLYLMRRLAVEQRP